MAKRRTQKIDEKRWSKPSSLMPADVWQPNKGSQEFAFDVRAKEILYWGDRGPGKTSWQIARALSRFFVGYGKRYKVLMMGLRIKSLSGCVAEVERILPKLEEKYKLKCRRKTSDGDWRWFSPLGEEFRIINLKTIEQAEDMIGQEYNIQMWNELCHYTSPRLYILLSGSARSVFDPETETPKDKNGEYLTPDKKPLPPCPEEILSATNTKGKGKLWVRRKFIEPVAIDEGNEYQLREIVSTHNIRGKDILLKSVSLQGVQGENPNLTDEYIAMLREQTKHDPALRREWCEGGDWYTPSGGAFDHLWNPDRHILLGDLKFDSNWMHCLSINYSSSRPTCVLWSAETDIDTKIGRYFFPAGSVIFYHELYLCDQGEPHLGERMSIRALAKRIVSESQKLKDAGVVREFVVDGYGSRNLFTPIAGGELADRLSDYDVYVDRVDIASDQRELREVGLALVRERLSSSADQEEDGIYFSEKCENSIRTLPDLPVEEDDPTVVDEGGEYYCYEAVRLRAMSMSAPIEELGFAY